MNASLISIEQSLSALTASRRAERRKLFIAGVVMIALLASIPLASSGAYDLGRYDVAVAYVTVAIGMNLAFGYCGELVLGFPTIMAASAYAAGILSAKYAWSALATLPVSIAAGIAAGLVTMAPGLRVRGWYLALITLFSVIVLPSIVSLAETYTGGEYGLTGVPPLSSGGQALPDWAVFEIGVALFALVLVANWNFLRSGWGTRLRALRDAPAGSRTAGLDPIRLRLTAYVLASIPAAIVGFYLAYAEQFVNPSEFSMTLTLMLLTGVVLGGAGTLIGPIVGMVPLLGLSFWAGPFSPYNAIVLGLGLLVGTLVFPDGIVPAVLKSLRRRAADAAAPLTDTIAKIADVVPMPAAAAKAPVRGIEAANGASAEPLVRAEGIQVAFGNNRVLCGVDLELEQGTLIGLVGPNGSGKSTLLNCISGFVRPQDGRLWIGGRDVSAHRVHQIAAAGVGRTFQIPQLIEDATALENISLGLLGTMPGRIAASIFRSPAIRRQEREIEERAHAIFREVGLPASAIDVPVSQLPLGLKRVVEIGRAVAHAPKLLLLDEPAAGLNDDERTQLGHLLHKLRARGATILVVEHNVPFVMEFCDELALLRAGNIACRASTRSALPPTLRSYLEHASEEDMDDEAMAAAVAS